jgi:hypothetical protein
VKVTLYHATHTRLVAKILKEGLRPFQTSNWIHAGSRKRYGRGEVYAFEELVDAVLWAAKLDWAVNQETGGGRTSVVEFVTDPRRWQADDADPLHQVLCRGRWLRYLGGVAPQDIVSAHALTHDEVRWASRLMRRAASGVPSEEAKKILQLDENAP